VTKGDVQKWASVQRGEYTRLKKGLRSKINPGQIAKLYGIGTGRNPETFRSGWTSPQGIDWLVGWWLV